MSDGLGRTAVHRLIAALSSATRDLGLGVPPLFVERWGVALHQALSSSAREFHSSEHVLSLVNPKDPLETIAALYHDTVYVQVDFGVPQHFSFLLAPLIAKEEGGWRILSHAGSNRTTRDVLDVFGRGVGSVMTPLTGLNELASALVVAKELDGVLSREQQVAVAACIEATIPFRDGSSDGLLDRIVSLGIERGQAVAMVRRATRLSNNDVGNFALADPAEFLDNTWKLLPETNPSLHTPEAYGITDYRVALQKMEEFLSQLKAESVFRNWGGEPGDAEHERRVEAARRNISLAVRYLRCKLFAVGMIEALAVESGGDAPLDYFMGGLPDADGPPMKRIEQFLPSVAEITGDPVLGALLHGGRTTPSSFDLSPSPLARLFFSALGEAALTSGVEDAKRWWARTSTAREFLHKQPRAMTIALAEAAACIAETRAEALNALAARL
jgi:hypothetical protein